MRWPQGIGLLMVITVAWCAEAYGAECDCEGILGVMYAGGEVCGVDGVKYGSACLAQCQGVAVSENRACGPGFALAVGGRQGELLDWGVIMRFVDKGMNYLGEEAGEVAEGQGHAPQGVEGGVIVDLLMTEDGAVYGRPITQDVIEGKKSLVLPGPRFVSGVQSRRQLSFATDFYRYQFIFKDNFKDDRSQVLNTDSDPWRRIGLVEPAGCTGVLVAPNKVLTAAHCIFSRETNSTRRRIRFAPAKDNEKRPYGTFSSRFTRFMSCYNSNDFGACDIGVITLTSFPGNTVGWFQVGSECTGQPVNLTIAGYPGDKDIQTMWFEVCGETEISCESGPQVIVIPCDVAEGMSGSPVWDEEGKVRGVLSGWYRRNGGNTATHITPEVQSLVQGWIAE